MKYVHGSEDSLDVDVVYVMDSMPSFQEAQEFCADKEENRNIIVVENGMVTDCFKGTIDELNNGVMDTYPLHHQIDPLIITKRAERDHLIKSVRVLRCLLSHMSRTTYRKKVKEALKSPSWNKKIETAKFIDFTSIDDYGPKGNKTDIHKVFAFQLGQYLGLEKGIELYTKSSIAYSFPDLKKYLYREEKADLEPMQKRIHEFLDIIVRFKIKEENDETEFLDFNRKINLKTEKYV